MNKLKLVAHSLQATSRVLSARGQMELAVLQETGAMLIGQLLLSGGELELVEDASAADVTRRMHEQGMSAETVVAALSRIDMAAWAGTSSANMVLLKSVATDADWDELPVLLQNLVRRQHMPCHVVMGIEQLTLEGDTQHRHAALPVLVLLQREGERRVKPWFAFATAEDRRQEHEDAQRVHQEATASLEPYMRIMIAGLAKTMETAA